MRKANKKWWICIDYINLNEVCPKDSFSLSKIDQLIDATSGHRFFSFMDAFAGYNQIQMTSKDEEHTVFTINKGIYCYKVMLFSLKNAGATYQRLINKVFKIQIGRNMKVYVDDMLIKSVETFDHIQNLEEALDTLRQYWMKLNLTKCAFRVTVRIFFRFFMSQ